MSWRCASAAALVFAAAASAGPEPATVSLRDLVLETQQLSDRMPRITMAWWMPSEFWRYSVEQSPGGSAHMGSEIVKVVSPYLIVAVVDGDVGPLGGVGYKDPDQLRKEVTVVTAGGAVLQPIAEADASPDVRNLLAMMRPMMANNLGQMGQSVTPMLFPALDPSGQRVADATRPGSFKLVVDDLQFEFRTPLASLVPKRRCPVDGEALSGNWQYCPWHGKPLAAPED